MRVYIAFGSNLKLFVKRNGVGIYVNDIFCIK